MSNNHEDLDEKEVKRLMDKMLSLMGSYVSTSLDRIRSKYKPLFDGFAAGFGLEAPLMDFDDDGVVFLESSYAELEKDGPHILPQMLSQLGIRASGYPLISTVGLVCLNVEYEGERRAAAKGTAIYAVERTQPIEVEGGRLHCARRVLIEAGGGVAGPVEVGTKELIEAARRSILDGRKQYSPHVDRYVQVFGFSPMEVAVGGDNIDVDTSVPAKLVPDLGDMAIAKIVGNEGFSVKEVDVGIHCTAKPVDREYVLNAEDDMLLLGSKLDERCIKYIMLRGGKQ